MAKNLVDGQGWQDHGTWYATCKVMAFLQTIGNLGQPCATLGNFGQPCATYGNLR